MGHVKPFPRYFGHIACRNTAPKQRVHRGVQGADSVPLRRVESRGRPEVEDGVGIDAGAGLLLARRRYILLESKVGVQCRDDVCRETPDVCGGHMGAFGDLEGVKGDEVDGGDLASLERGEDVRVGFCRKGRQDGEQIHNKYIVQCWHEREKKRVFYGDECGQSDWINVYKM